ncbi:hypothetical protein ASPWEDRAFT_41490 [Aspergillus wentii DTO 134E9]|uniref:DUF4419 domain-containing protein n=1 Tax=Aspergillus wentii DTO 134E9 TaxID=1073089 RepID=A0A1L9RFF6_ASPWE|nr:uncharacterized protein ASPWEDRAFT_41490 [Aspergillus wentii DTO 134E9]KAI9925410.1 hypothetical protein MW887_005791 [Aspergillus wentii]OJJ33640.1 hypothetical protein ASPWEDRAFT_41490 [Aspergillus wentii DTO 134E9]
MPVTLNTSSQLPRRWRDDKTSSADQLFANSCPEEHRKSKRIIQHSISPSQFDGHLSSSQNGFVRAVWHAYSGHHHLTVRPEDVWFSILTQINFYINAHAEELRSLFVAHEGQKELSVSAGGTIDTANFGALAVEMTRVIEENVVDPELRSWIMPDFTTTTESDKVVAAVLLMGTLQKYFSYNMMLMCGIPSVTLLGEKKDWEALVAKLDKLPTFGKEPTQFASLLRPVLTRFVASFDDPTSQETIDFWSKSVHKSGGSGPHYLSGWITAFCFWNQEGVPLYREPTGPVSLEDFKAQSAGCELDGVLFHRVDTDNIPTAFAHVPVNVNDNGREYKTTMLAGLIGIEAKSSGAVLQVDLDYEYGFTGTKTPGVDSIKPVSGWFMYENKSEAELAALQTEEVVYTV